MCITTARGETIGSSNITGTLLHEALRGGDSIIEIAGEAYHSRKVELLHMADLESPAFTASVQSLCDAWQVKYSNTWVHVEDLDSFFEQAAQRLIALGKLEAHHISGNGRVARLPV